MPSYSIQLLEYLNPNWRDLKVRTVIFPVPPVRVKNVIHAVDAWRSTVLDQTAKILTDHSYTVLGSCLTDCGPAFAIERKLEDLFYDSHTLDRASVRDAFCANVSYTSFTVAKNVEFSNDILIESLQRIRTSCNAGSHTAVPESPMLTLLLQLERAKIDPSEKVHDFTYVDDEAARQLFKDVDFYENREVDSLFQYLNIEDALGASSDKIVVHSQVSSRLRQLGIAVLEGNSLIRQRFLIIEQFTRIIDRKIQLVKEANHEREDV